MSETIEMGCDGQPKWHWFNIMHDLENQGGIKVSIDPMSFHMGTFGGETDKDEKFAVTWIKDMFLLVSAKKEIPKLIEAFSKVVEYKPFCKYINAYGLVTYEWDKIDPNARCIELIAEGFSPTLINSTNWEVNK